MELPFFKIWVKDFLGDNRVSAMTTEQVGAYFLLLLHAWQEQPPATLPNDDILLARLARLDADRWQACRQVLSCFAVTRDGRRLEQKRLLAEYADAVRKRKLRSDAGKKGAEQRWQQNQTLGWQTHSNAIGLPMAKECDSGSGFGSGSLEAKTKSEAEVRPPVRDGPRDGQEWPHFLTGEWIHYCRGAAKHRNPDEMLPFFIDLCETAEVPPERIRDGIRDPKRPKRQAPWQFEKWLIPPAAMRPDPGAIAAAAKASEARANIERIRREKADPNNRPLAEVLADPALREKLDRARGKRDG